MNAELLSLLRNTDDPNNWEYPRRFRWKKEIVDVEAVKSKLEKVLGQQLEMDKNVQDASFFTELAWHTPERHIVGIGLTKLTYVAIRFSAFGRFVTICGNVPEAPLAAGLVDELVKVLSTAGFTYIPAEVLAEKYDGCVRGAPEDTTWWDRYFDYS
jgi:hypothetical protein